MSPSLWPLYTVRLVRYGCKKKKKKYYLSFCCFAKQKITHFVLFINVTTTVFYNIIICPGAEACIPDLR